VFRNEELREHSLAAEWLEESDEIIESARGDSNFETEINEFYLDHVTFGMGSFHCEPELPLHKPDDGLFHGYWYHTYHLSEIRAAENSKGILDTQFRKCKFTVEQAVEKFGLEALDEVRRGVSDKVRQEYQAGNLEIEHEYLHAIYPRMLPGKVKYPAMPNERPYASVYVDITEKKLVKVDGLYEQSRYMPRWLGRSDDWGGYGPGERALNDILSANQARKLHLAGHEKLIDPPMLAKANAIIGDPHFEAKGITYLTRLDDLKGLDVQPNLTGAMAELELIRENIRHAFMWDALDLPRREEVGQMTKYEVAKRIEKAYQRLGPTVGRLQRELLNPLLKREFAIAARRGALPRPPEIVMQAGGAAEVDIIYQSPLANAQRMEEVAAADAWVDRLLELSEVAPEVLDNLEPDEYARVSGRQGGVPEKIIRNQDKVKKLRKQRQAQEEEAAALARGQAGADVLKTASDAAASGGLQKLEQANVGSG